MLVLLGINMLFRADENEIKRDTNDDHDLKNLVRKEYNKNAMGRLLP